MRSKMPKHYKELNKHISDCDGVIPHDLESKLKNERVRSSHVAENFYGFIWWARRKKKFVEEVWRYGSPVDLLEADSLRELMDSVNTIYGEEKRYE